jgi:hypothetical protein
MSDLDDIFGEFHDRAVPGGCDSCNAFQTVETVRPGVHIIHINHDAWCVAYRSMNAEAN